jgi:hypothetical protein
MRQKRRQFDNLLNKLAAQEEAFFNEEFLSPVVAGTPIRVRLAGVVMSLTVTRPKDFSGWGTFRALSPKTARFVREPTMAERRRYLDLFPSLRLIVCARNDKDEWLGIPANSSDSRFRISGLVPIRLATEVQMFERVVSRFDGANCWYDEPDSSGSLKSASVLREALAQETEAAKVSHSGLTKEEKDAYVIAFLREIENKKDKNEERIRQAIERAGAQYRSYVERGESYTVEYVVDGETHKSVVSKNTLDVQSAGICLSGGDAAFSLQSLVSVVREGQNRHRIVRVGLNEDNYYDDYD